MKEVKKLLIVQIDVSFFVKIMSIMLCFSFIAGNDFESPIYQSYKTDIQAVLAVAIMLLAIFLYRKMKSEIKLLNKQIHEISSII